MVFFFISILKLKVPKNDVSLVRAAVGGKLKSPGTANYLWHPSR